MEGNDEKETVKIMTTFESVVLKGIHGMVLGAVGQALGYYSRTDRKEEFSKTKFGSSVLIGGVAGAVLGFSGITFDDAVIDNFVTLSVSVGIPETLKRIFKLAKW